MLARQLTELIVSWYFRLVVTSLFGKKVYDAFEQCQQYGGQNKGLYPAFYDTVFREIILCPHFFSMPTISARSPCLTVNKYQGNFYQDGRNMFDFQLWAVMHELVHFYLPGPPHLEVYNVNDCLRLSAEKSIQNAQSYVYYAASKSAIRTDCYLPRSQCVY